MIVLLHLCGPEKKRNSQLYSTALSRDQAFASFFGADRFSTFATWGNSGIEPDKGKGISSPGMYEARLMWPCNDGERQWNTMSDWTCR
jgi:hypothetical protein